MTAKVSNGDGEAKDGLSKPQALQSGKLPRESPSLCPLLAVAWGLVPSFRFVIWNMER